MIGVFICAAVSLAIFALAALADERWPDRLTRRGQHLRGERWQGHWGPVPAYRAANRQSNRGAPAPGLQSPSVIGH